MNPSPGKLPQPDPHATAHSLALCELIRAQAPCRFDKFMQMALYQPGYGYYSAGATKLGAAGDFITAPELTPLFGQTLANQCAEIFTTLDKPHLLEFGAGTGALAAAIIPALAKLQQLPEFYHIVEVSPDLRLRQQQLLQQACPEFFDRIIWHETLPQDTFEAVIIANEVLDAMPVRKFAYTPAGVFEFFVHANAEGLQLEPQPACDDFAQTVTTLATNYFPDCDHYTSEINPALAAWIKACAQILRRGAILLIDYGFPAHEYYHPDRHMGTLMCHYQHRAHTDPLLYIGLQDITAHVDMTAVAEAAVANNLHVAGFTNQAAFLLGNGITELLGNNPDFTAQQAVKRLTLPSEMGELFKVIALTQDLDQPLRGFALHDQRYRL